MSEEPFIQFKLRIPESIKDRLERACEESGRSLSAEILFRLDASLPRSLSDLRLRDLRRALWEADIRLNLKKHQLAEVQRMLLSVPEGHQDRQIYQQKIDVLNEDVSHALDLLNIVTAELATYSREAGHQD